MRPSDSNKRSRWIFGVERKFQRDKRMHLVNHAPHHSDFFCSPRLPRSSLSLSLPFFFSILSPIYSDRGRNYYFLTSTKRLILQRSIYRTPRWQPSHVGEWHREWLRFARTVASSTLHTILRRWLNRLPSSYSSSLLSSSCSFFFPPRFLLSFFSPRFVHGHLRYRSKDPFLLEILTDWLFGFLSFDSAIIVDLFFSIF